MKMRLATASVFLCLAMLCTTIPAKAENVVQIVNQTGKTIVYLYVSPSGTNSWEEDVLSPQVLNIRTLESGYYCEVNLEMADLYDLRPNIGTALMTNIFK